MGCNAETLRLWVRLCEAERGARAGLTTDDRECMRRSKELLAALFAGVLDA